MCICVLRSEVFWQDIKGDWKKLGAGSFGNVYKGVSSLAFYLIFLTAAPRILPWNRCSDQGSLAVQRLRRRKIF